MRLFGFEITRIKTLQTVAENRGGWWPLSWVREPFSGAWQRDIECSTDQVLGHHAVYSCITRIASDVGKLSFVYETKDADGIWSQQSNASYDGVLLNPNHFQDHVQFKENWITSKLIRGNTYVLKERDNRGGEGRGNVRALFILDPQRVTVLVADDGSVFYQLSGDNLTGLAEHSVTVPASEIIHDRMNCLFHPLVGVSPIFASGLAANVGIQIEKNSAHFFGNGSNPSGVLTGPNPITNEQAAVLQERWTKGYTGATNAGKVAVLGGGLEFKPLRMTAVESQMLEHLKWSAETVCGTFHVPAFKVGVGQMPTYQNAAILDQIYYKDCLQSHITRLEVSLTGGLGLDGQTKRVGIDEDELFRMDQGSLFTSLETGVKGGFMAPNEARARVNLSPVQGGDTPYLQQQNYSLAALDARDRAAPAPSDGGQGGPSTPPDEAPDPEATTEGERRAYFAARRKSFRHAQKEAA